MRFCAYIPRNECIETDECESKSVCCDECEDIDSEGYCDNKNGRLYPQFVDGLVVCCNRFRKAKND